MGKEARDSRITNKVRLGYFLGFPVVTASAIPKVQVLSVPLHLPFPCPSPAHSPPLPLPLPPLVPSTFRGWIEMQKREGTRSGISLWNSTQRYKISLPSRHTFRFLAAFFLVPASWARSSPWLLSLVFHVSFLWLSLLIPAGTLLVLDWSVPTWSPFARFIAAISPQ